jgi:dolichol-phosphate mannosyltransferase
MLDLIVIMPVYNEEGSIERVLRAWLQTLDQLAVDYAIHVYNDGSQDATPALLDQLSDKHQRLFVHHKANSGHGPTILRGYNEQGAQAEWLMQVDSDDEIDVTYFKTLWDSREEYDFLIGERVNRQSPFLRKLVSTVSTYVVRILYGKGITDVNSPFRLMRMQVLRPYMAKIPPQTFAPNVLLSGTACREKLRILTLPVTFTPRKTGKVSLNKGRLVLAAVRSFFQSIAFAFK